MLFFVVNLWSKNILFCFKVLSIVQPEMRGGGTSIIRPIYINFLHERACFFIIWKTLALWNYKKLFLFLVAFILMWRAQPKLGRMTPSYGTWALLNLPICRLRIKVQWFCIFFTILKMLTLKWLPGDLRSLKNTKNFFLVHTPRKGWLSPNRKISILASISQVWFFHFALTNCNQNFRVPST